MPDFVPPVAGPSLKVLIFPLRNPINVTKYLKKAKIFKRIKKIFEILFEGF